MIEEIKVRAKKNKKVIVLLEAEDSRVLEAASLVLKEGIADIILIGDKDDILGKGYDVSLAKIISPDTFSLTEEFVQLLYEMRKEKGLSLEDARNLILNDYMYFSCMLFLRGYADGIVSGACHSTSNTLRPALQILKTREGADMVSSFFLMDVPNCDYGDNGVFLFSDCGMVQNPTKEELSSIALESAYSFEFLTGNKPYVAMLSYSTLGSASHVDVDKVREATMLVKEKKSVVVDGELQLDAAIVPEVAKMKAPDSEVAGRANVLIFPNLDAGNIGYKLVQRLGKAEAYGPICQGFSKPVNDLSRGASVMDIVGVIAITVVQASM